MTYYVLNHGVKFDYPRAEIRPGVIERLRFLLPNGGQLPRPFDRFHVEAAHLDGGSLFTLWRETQSVTISGLAWTQNGAAEIWECLESVYYDVSDRYPSWMAAEHVPTCPEALPWLASVYLPASPITAQDRTEWSGDFNRCFGWAVALERKPRPNAA